MAKERSGYVFEERGKWYARLTYTEPSGKRRNVKRRAESKTDAKAVLKQLVSELEEHGGESLETANQAGCHPQDAVVDMLCSWRVMPGVRRLANPEVVGYQSY